MRTGFRLAVIAALLAAASAFAAQADDDTPDKYFARALAKIKTYDPEQHARQSVAAHDYRPVVIDYVWGGPRIPGITCTDIPAEQRGLFFSDVINGDLDATYRDALDKAAERFNRALVTQPSYPDRDICFISPNELNTAEAAEMARQPARRPAIVDLHTAARAGDSMAVKIFLAQGTKVDTVDHWQRAPLMWAVRRKNREITNLLIAAGAEPGQATDFFVMALTIAVEAGDIDVVRTLLTAGPKGKRSRGSKWYPYTSTPLVAAVALKRADLVRLLVQFGAIPERSDGEIWDVPLEDAAANTCLECLEAMLAAGGRELAESPSVHRIVKQQLDGKPSPVLLAIVRTAIDSLSYSRPHRDALAAAVAVNDRAMVKLLLAKGQDVNLLTADEVAKLKQAAGSKDAAGVEKLVDEATRRRRIVENAILENDTAGIRANVPKGTSLAQDHAFTLLMFAAKTANAATIETLIDLGATVNAQMDATDYSNRGFPLLFALEGLNVEAARTLLRHGALVDVKSSGWPLAVDFSRLIKGVSAEQRRQLVEMMLLSTTEQQRRTRLGLMLASSAASVDDDLTRLLLKLGARPCEAIDYYQSPITGAAQGDSLALFKEMIALCPDWSPASKHARAALKGLLSEINLTFEEPKLERLKILTYLLDQKTPLPPPDCNTVLTNAVLHGDTRLIDMLLKAGADINEVCENRTALDAALGYRDSKAIVAFLRSHGAKTAEELGLKVDKQPESFPF